MKKEVINMAKRPAWSVQDDVVICENFDFMWSGGFSITQKQKILERYISLSMK